MKPYVVYPLFRPNIFAITRSHPAVGAQGMQHGPYRKYSLYLPLKYFRTPGEESSQSGFSLKSNISRSVLKILQNILF